MNVLSILLSAQILLFLDTETNHAAMGELQPFTIVALYKFVNPHFDADHVKRLRIELDSFLRQQQVFGNLLLGAEGINGTICYNSCCKAKVDDPVCVYFEKTFPGIRLRLSYDNRQVFHRLKIRIKNEIVTLGIPGIDPCRNVGTYIPPGPAWHDLLNDPDTLVIDTRNDYEVKLGTFKNAVNPRTDAFTEFPSWLETQLAVADTTDGQTTKYRPKRLAMFCTGGIRCEKATSYCLTQPSVADIPVYHLEGGILAYLDTVPESESLWQGECFVFDQRIAVGHGLKPSTQYTLCHACRHPLGPTDRASPEFQQGVVCPYCVHLPDKEQRRERYQERQKQCLLSNETATPHIHDGKYTPQKALQQTQGYII